MYKLNPAIRQQLLMIAGVCALALGWLFGYAGPIDKSRLTFSSYVTDHEGELLHVLMASDERYRIQTLSNDVDDTFIDLLLAYEDQRYYEHQGVDWLAMGRAAWQWASRGEIISGGSTISMQVIRILEPKPRTVWNKLDQMRKAIALERTYNKQDILSLYLSLAPYGSNIEGVQMASLSWFGKWANELTPAESSLLVALPQSPERRRPDRFSDRALKAREIVLERALDKGLISQEYMAMAVLSPVPSHIKKMPKMAPHLAYKLKSEGLFQATSTLNHDYQATLNTIADNLQLKPNTNVSMMLVHAATGEVRAYIGSQNYNDFRNLGAIDYSNAVRSPGSTLKPFIYAQAASEQLIHLNGLIRDEGININGYQPQNISRIFHGDITIGEALQRSLNIPAVKVLSKLGPERFKSKLAQADIPLRQGEGLPIALGGAGLKLNELVSLYTALANGGTVMPIHYVKASMDQPTQHAQSIFAADEIAQVNYFLSHNTTGSGRLHGRIKSRAISYKTGTGPGGSDAWALGTDGDYVVGIWVGSPTGERLPENTGLREAAPLMNKVFDALPRAQLDIIVPGQAPVALVRADKPNTEMSIRFPMNGIAIEARNSNAPIPFVVDNVEYPVVVIINDSEVHEFLKGPIGLELNQKGSYDIALIGSNGGSSSVSFILQ